MITLADAIINEQLPIISEYLNRGALVNDLDEYGFTPLIEAAIADNIEIVTLLLRYHASVNLKDATGGTPLHWAVENNNLAITRLLIEQGADPNAYNFAGQPVLVMPLLRKQQAVKEYLLRHGANLQFAQDYINTKLLGHMFELVGTANIIDVNHRFVEVDFEGFILEFSLELVTESVEQFKNHFSARQLRRYTPLIDLTIAAMRRAVQLMKYTQYRVNIQKFPTQINALLQEEPLVIPVGYEGHAITFIKMGTIFVKCDRREDSRLYDNVMIYQMGRAPVLTMDFIKSLIYEQKSSDFINEELQAVLGLQPITEIKVTAQISGNCSWANVEACLPALFFLLSSHVDDFNQNMAHYKSLAMHFFQQWREWNKDRALYFCIESFREAGPLRKATKAEILSAILFQCCNEDSNLATKRAEDILEVLMASPYEYVLQNYVKTYCYESSSEEGRHFLQMLKKYGYRPPR